MESLITYLALSGILTVLLWTPYIVDRLFSWGLKDFLLNYPKWFPVEEPKTPMWAQRAKRAHLNMVETMPAFVAVVVAAIATGDAGVISSAAFWAQIFFFARIIHALVYILAVPAMRTPVYLVSWFAILMIGAGIIL